MGQALYRKYRSKSLKEIVGQEHITDTLTEAIKNGRISHAYLFTGPRGVGKTSIARILAHEINKLPYDEHQTHIDIIEIDAASNRRIDEIRELRDKIYVAPASAKYKVYIIDEVHMLTREAFNALLKTLEEPPEHAIFILATTEAHKLPDTIVSRTQRYVFRPIESKKAAEHLRDIANKEKIDISDDALALIVEHGNGSFRDSISLLDQLRNYEAKIDLETVQSTLGVAPADTVNELLRLIQSGEPAETLYAQLADLLDRGYQPANIAKQLAKTLRHELFSAASITTNDTILLSALLEVPLSHDPEGRLETALLSYRAVEVKHIATNSFKNQDVKSAKQNKKSPQKAEVHTVPETLSESSSEQASSLPTAPTAELPPAAAQDTVFDANAWPLILDILKKQYNTLYGIVRMAQPDFSKPGMLHLSFGFAFHQKRANEAKNRKIIQDAVAAITSQNIEISCTYDAEAKPVQPTLATTKSASIASAPSTNTPLSTISNIFGGVEMVE